MYVFEDFRKKGIAGLLVQHLLQQVPAGAMVYCLPFQHLLTFYENYGFEKIEETALENTPETVREKLAWCNASYPDPVVLLGQKIE